MSERRQLPCAARSSSAGKDWKRTGTERNSVFLDDEPSVCSSYSLKHEEIGRAHV